MGNKKKLVAQSYYEISDVSGSGTVLDVDRDQNVFTLLKNTYTADGMRHISLNELEQHINTYKLIKSAKTDNQAILKGLYLDGFNGVNCVKNAPFLFFDIDIRDTKEKKENTHLLAPATNEIIFRKLKNISVLVWRSNSGNGIAGILYVPQMAEYLNDRRDLHLQVGKKITSYLSDYLHNETGIARVKFDDAQSKLRQIRYLAQQEQTRGINNNPFVFTYLVEEKTKYIAPNVTAYRYSDHRTPYGTIYDQFNNSNDILSVAQQNGFTIASNSGNKIRLKHPNTTSATSGEIDTGLNLYFNYSESVSSKKSFTPSEMVCHFGFSGNWYNFRKYLVEQGYQEKKKPQNEVKQTAENLKRELATSTEPDKAIFSACYDLQTLTDDEKKNFIKDTCTDDAYLPYFKSYLKIQDYKIKYDANFYIKKYVAEALPNILDYADQHHKIILRAETGKGKTTAFIRDFHKHRPNARLLVLVPLTVILRQNRKEYGDKGVFVDGSNVSYELEKTYYENLVFATYEQGAKILHYSSFDYVVIDEAHQLINANSYKKEVIADLVPHLETNKIIGLTGTPSEIFKHIGYKLANVDLKTPERTKLNVRYSNSETADIALQHLSNVKGKTIIRLNEIKTLDEVKTRLLRDYAEDEILILYATEEIKKGSDYNGLAYDRAFTEKVKIVLTTSLIDEGLSIDQEGFTDVVLIETDYSPKPEAIKQFFARFRNVDNNRKNFVYLRQKEDQTHSRFNIGYSYQDTLKALENEANEFGVDEIASTYKSLFSNANFFLDGGTINKYYLGYSVNDILFKTLNKEQFREYLTTNFYFSLSVEEQKQEAQRFGANGNRKQIKRGIASLWKNSFDEVIHTLSVHSLDMGIRNALGRSQIGVTQEMADFIIKYIKDFEKLFKAKNQINKLGVEDENNILLKLDSDLTITLNSQQEIKKSIHLLKLKNVLDNPKTKADHKEKERFEMLVEWCRSRKEFTNPEMFRYLKKIGVRNISAFNERMILEVMKWYNLEVKRDKNYNVLRC